MPANKPEEDLDLTLEKSQQNLNSADTRDVTFDADSTLPEAERENSDGVRIPGYRIEKLLAKGGMGCVFAFHICNYLVIHFADHRRSFFKVSFVC